MTDQKYQELDKIATENKTDKASWCHDYMYAYSRHFEKFREEDIVILEIGVSNGSSLRTWRNYFKNAKIYGIDIGEAAVAATRGEFKVFVGDQANKDFLIECIKEIGQPTIIIDDGGHTMTQQIVSFETLFPELNPGGIYVVEDLHTSYIPRFMDQKKTAMDFLADLVWAPNFYGKFPAGKEALGSKKLHCEYMDGYAPTFYEKWIKSLSFYRSICFIEKEME